MANDMAASFQAAIEAELPEVEIVHNKFHIIRHLNEAVDQIRRAENKALSAEGDDSFKSPRQI